MCLSSCSADFQGLVGAWLAPHFKIGHVRCRGREHITGALLDGGKYGDRGDDDGDAVSEDEDDTLDRRW